MEVSRICLAMPSPSSSAMAYSDRSLSSEISLSIALEYPFQANARERTRMIHKCCYCYDHTIELSQPTKDHDGSLAPLQSQPEQRLLDVDGDLRDKVDIRAN